METKEKVLEAMKSAGEPLNAGKIAVEKAVEGVTDRMVGFLRSYDENGNYVCEYGVFDLLGVANTEKKIPAEWFNETKDGLTEEFIKYALPLIQGETQMIKQDSLPRFTRLKKIKATV
jgi:6-phosphofructokinase 1